MSHKHIGSMCPGCKTVLDSSASLDLKNLDKKDESRPPEKGDIAVCGYCGDINMFEEDLRMIPATANRLADMEPLDIQRMFKAQGAIREMRDARS